MYTSNNNVFKYDLNDKQKYWKFINKEVSLNGILSTNRLTTPTEERLIELTKYYKILIDYNVKLYNMKLLFKRKITLTEYDINIIFLVKQIYNNIDEIIILLSMLINHPIYYNMDNYSINF